MEAKISLANIFPLSKGPIKRKHSKSEKIRRKIMRRERRRATRRSNQKVKKNMKV